MRGGRVRVRVRDGDLLIGVVGVDLERGENGAVFRELLMVSWVLVFGVIFSLLLGFRMEMRIKRVYLVWLSSLSNCVY